MEMEQKGASPAVNAGTPGWALVLLLAVFVWCAVKLHVRYQVDLPSLAVLGAVVGVAGGLICRRIWGVPTPKEEAPESETSQAES